MPPLEKYTQVASLKDAYAGKYKIGEGSYGGLNVYSYDEATKIEIGAYCSFAFGVTAILGGDHRADWATTFPFPDLWPEAAGIQGHPATKGDIKIGSDVWVGAEALICSGVTIGDGAVIAARAVVTHDVAPYAMVGGSPARLLDWRFDHETIQRFLDVKWWDWPRERIVKALPALLRPHPGFFLHDAERGRL